jgi:outer membrane protein assembly factor BamB
MLRSLCLVLALISLQSAAVAASPVAWSRVPTMLQFPDACIGFGRSYPPIYIPSDICPDPQGSLLVRSATPVPGLLLQTSARGRLMRVGGTSPADSSVVDEAFMSQAMSARELRDGTTLVMSAEVTSGYPLHAYIRPSLSLFDQNGEAQWTVPISGMLEMSSRDGRAGFVAELSPGGDLIAIVQTDLLTAVRVRRSDGRVEARTVLPAPVLATRSLPTKTATKSDSAYSSVPFQAWFGPGGLHIVTTYRWLRLDPVTLTVRSIEIWPDLLQETQLQPTAIAAIEGSDDVLLWAYGPYVNGDERNCTLLRTAFSGEPIWSTVIDECQPEPLLELSGAQRWVSAAIRYAPFGRELLVGDLGTGAVEREIAVTDQPRRLASTASTVAYLAYGEAGLALHGVDLNTGTQTYRHALDFPADSQLPNPTPSLIPALAAHGGDSFVVHSGRSHDFKSLGFIAHVIDAESGATRQQLEPGPAPNTTQLTIVAHSSDGLTLDIHPSSGADWPRRIERVRTVTGEPLWSKELSAIWDRSSAMVVANDQYVLIVELRRLAAPERRQVHAVLLEAQTGTTVYSVQRELTPLSPNSNFQVSLTPEGNVLMLAQSSPGLRAIALDLTGGEAWQADFADIWLVARTDQDRWLLRYVNAGTEKLGILSGTDGSLQDLGAFDANQSVHAAIEIGGDGKELWLLSSRVQAGQQVFSVQRRRINEGTLWTHETIFPTNATVLLLASATMPDQDLVYQLRSIQTLSTSVIGRTLRLDGVTGVALWDQIDNIARGVSTGCRAIVPAANGDVLCVESYGQATTAMSGVDPALTYVRRLDAATGELKGVHWLSIESDALRGLLRGDGPSTRIFLATGNSGFAYSGPAPGERAFTIGAAGWFDSPTLEALGDVSVTSTPDPGGFGFSIRNNSAARAEGVRWAIDSHENAALDTLVCTDGMLSGALVRPYGAQGVLDLGPGESAQCMARWLSSVPPAQRKTMVFAWPAYGYLDADPMNNVSQSLGEALFADGYE